MRSKPPHATDIYNLSCEWKSDATSDQLDALVRKIDAVIQKEPANDTVKFLEALKFRVLAQKPVAKEYEKLGKKFSELEMSLPTSYRMIEPTRGTSAAETDVMMSEGPTLTSHTFEIDPSIPFAESPYLYDEPEPFISFSFNKPSIPPMPAGPSEWYSEGVPLSTFSGTSLVSSRTSGSMGPPASIRPLPPRRLTNPRAHPAQEQPRKRLRRV